MKKRCQKLQRTATLLEDENISLKRQLARHGGEKVTSSDGSAVQEQVYFYQFKNFGFTFILFILIDRCSNSPKKSALLKTATGGV